MKSKKLITYAILLLGFGLQTTLAQTVTDKDGNIYHTVIIGTQMWMEENLKTTKFNDGTSIPIVTDKTAWGNLKSPAYCWYNNDATTYKNKYGALYNWYAIYTGKLAPLGWHVATYEDWRKLNDYVQANLGTSIFIGKALAANIDWKTSDIWNSIGKDLSTNNSSGFLALPGGIRYGGSGDPDFSQINKSAIWWTSDYYGWVAVLDYKFPNLGLVHYSSLYYGLSVRCVKGR